MPLRWCNCWRTSVPEDDAEKLLAENEVTEVSFETGEYHVSMPGRTHVSSLPQDDDKDGSRSSSSSSSSNEGDDGDDEEEEESQEWGQQPKKHNSAFEEQLKKSITQASERQEIRRLSSGDSEGSTRSDLSHDSYASFHCAKKGESSSSMASARRSGSQRLFDDDDDDDGSRRWPRRATTGSDEDEDDTSFRGNAASFMQSRRVLDGAKQ